MPKTPAEMHVFIVETTKGEGHVPTVRRIEAAYHQAEDGLVSFKDANHQAVFTVRNDLLLTIERAEGADPVVSEFMRLAAIARKTGHAHGKVTWETSDEPGGRIHRSGYDITIVRTGESVSGSPA